DRGKRRDADYSASRLDQHRADCRGPSDMAVPFRAAVPGGFGCCSRPRRHGRLGSRGRPSDGTDGRNDSLQVCRVDSAAMDLKLTGKVAVVTGASRGIGRAIAQTLAAEGMKLSLVARSKDQLEELARSLKTDCLVQAVDLRAHSAAAAVVDETMKKFGAIDLLVNNAGATRRGDFFELTDADWEDGFALKFFGAMRLCRAAWTH